MMVCSPIDRMDLAARLPCTMVMGIPRTGAAAAQVTISGHARREQAPQTRNERLVVVQSEWNGWRTAVARLTDLEAIHWSRPNGAPHPLLHASIRCDQFEFGNLPHNCELTPSPHRLTVCLLKRYMAPCVFEELSRRADASLPRDAPNRPDGALGPVDPRTLASRVDRTFFARVWLGAIVFLTVVSGAWWLHTLKRTTTRAIRRVRLL